MQISKKTQQFGPIQSYLILLVIAIIARHPTFFPLVIDSDEGTYLVMSHELLKGAKLYVDVIDIKPPGIFMIFSAIEWFFGQSIFAVRVIATFAVATSAFLLLRIKLHLGFAKISAWLSAFLFIAIFNFYFAAAINTEHFFVLCSIAGFYFFVKHNQNWKLLLVSGFCFGVGFIIKPLVLFEFAAAGLMLIFWHEGRLYTFIQKAVAFIITFLLPFAACHLYFYAVGNLDDYLFITYEAPANYAAERLWINNAIFLAKGFVAMLPFFVAFVFGVLFSKQMNKNRRIFIGTIFCFTILAVIAPNKNFPHYWLQLAFILSFAGGEIVTIEAVKKWLLNLWFRRSIIGILSIYCFILGCFYYQKYIIKESTAEKVYKYLKGNINKEESIYTANGPTVLYYLLDKKPPTAYVHGTLLTTDGHIKTLGIDAKAELGKILEQKPTYITLHDPYPDQWFLEQLMMHYTKVSQHDNIGVWKRGK